MTLHTTTTTAPRRSLFSRTPRPARTTRFGRKQRTTAVPRAGGLGHSTGVLGRGATTTTNHRTMDGHRTEKVVVQPARRSRLGFRHRPVVVEKKKPTIGDKISGAMMRLKGSLSGRRAEEVRGKRRMDGTEGGVREVRHY
ncbi:hypothetical protein VE01_05463 [Pseudogymnoascus verrucosus]|uniref:Uncharacterized protein n=1 Tax=Pseudogymnoascus verrucosus TaxID=342668 RepID=A0A1B8GM95_9PEZI|nr:uncharacterized protein VE01_05463 [Pseudogymnoascus verrucosus]OBT96926.1 hypothetical protein VE01_05463 [Pseudogymnoascus verrucosus]